jgi:hypothetical protein
MPQDPNRWKIRFGQIFQAMLAESGKRLEDHLYFMPTGITPNPHDKKSFELVDLHDNRDFYTTYFSGDIPHIPALTAQTAKRLDATLVIVPGFGHHLLKQKAFGDQIPLLKDLGFNILYAFYEDSFESADKCAQRVYDIVKRERDDHQQLIFLTYSKGSPILVELLATPRYSDVAQRTRAVVSFAGALRGSILASAKASRATLRLLKAYKRFSRRIGLRTKFFRKIIHWASKLRIPGLKDLDVFFEKAAEFSDDLTDLPEGITDLMRVTSEHDHAGVRVPDSIKLFSISAVYPEAAFEKGLQFVTNPDDLFLYVNGQELYKHNVFNDTQVLLPDSEFFEGIGAIINLGIVKADHWGMALPRVYSRRHKDPFPRTEMLKAALLVLDEYFSTSH